MATIFDVIADTTRRQILELLRQKPRLVGELADILQISQPGISKHLRMLREVGLVRVRQDAQRHWYELRAEPLAELDVWLSDYREMWSHRLNALEDLLQEKPQDEHDDDR